MALVINVGMPKSGTKSFADATALLGFNSYHNPRKFLQKMSTRPRNMDLGFVDGDSSSNFGEWLWEPLHEAYPAAVFVCTYRSDLAAWLRSTEGMMRRQGKFDWANAWRWTYGVGYYFEPAIKNALLMHDICFKRWARAKGVPFRMQEVSDGWEPLCEWLDLPVPDVSYPWSHKGGER